MRSIKGTEHRYKGSIPTERRTKMDYSNENQSGTETREGMNPDANRSKEEPEVVSEQIATPAEPGTNTDGWIQPGDITLAPAPSDIQNAEPAWNSGSSQQLGGQRGCNQNNQPGGYANSQPGGYANSQPGGYANNQPGGYVNSQPGGYVNSQPGGYANNQPGGYANNQQGCNYQNQTQYHTQYQSHGEQQNGMAVISLVMGILSLVTCCCGWINLPLGILGIIFALISRNGKQSMDSQATAGLIMSCVSIGLYIISVIFILLFSFFPRITYY